MTRRRKILLIGWDAAELRVIMPLVDRGEMPHFERLLNHGAIGRLNTIQPLFSPLLWTTALTGKAPAEHGVLASFEPNPNGKGARPFSSASRRCCALWNILSAGKIRAHVIGWPATYPAEHINGVMISDQYNRATKGLDEEWHLPEASIFPERLRADLAELRFHPAEFSVEQLRSFVPAIESDPAWLEKQPLVAALASRLAECSTTHFAATYLLETEPWDFAAVYFDALDPIQRDFMEFAPPQLPHIAAADFELFGNVVDETYRTFDQMLGRLVELAGPEATVMVCSTHGWFVGEERPVLAESEHGAGAMMHRPAGFLLMRGEGVREDEWFYGGDIFGITPTILHLAGLPLARDMAGRPFLQALEQTSGQIDCVESWENRCERKPPNEQLPLPLDEEARTAREEIDYNLGVFLLTSNQPKAALPLLEQMVKAQPHRTSPVLNLINCHHALGNVAEARQLLEQRAALPEGGMSRREGKRSKFTPQWDLMRGILDLQERKFASALVHFERAQAAQPQLPGMHLQLGHVYTALGRRDDARRAFIRALEIDPDSAEAHFALAIAEYKRRDFRAAADYAMEAAGIAPAIARAHLLLGLALAHLGEDEQAQLALGHAVQRDGNVILAHRALALLYRKNPAHHAMADLHRRAANALREQMRRGRK